MEYAAHKENRALKLDQKVEMEYVLSVLDFVSTKQNCLQKLWYSKKYLIHKQSP